MKKLFQQQDKTAMLIGIGAVAVVAGAAAYFYLTDEGKHQKGRLREKLKDHVRDIASTAISKKTGLSKKTVRKAADHIG